VLTIDADAHVIETDQTWDYLDAADEQHRPRVVVEAGADGATAESWLIDGKLHARQANVGQDTPRESRELLEVERRLSHMDELGVDVQVIYPTLILKPLSSHPEVERALCQTYNRWMSAIWKRSRNRLRWVAVVPLLSMDAALAELAAAKERGACGVLVRPLEGGRRLGDPYFAPLYEAASRLDVPICVHSGNGTAMLRDFYATDCGFSAFKLSGVGAFHELLFNEVPARFPNLRWGFVELSAQWVPYALHDLARRFEKRGKRLSPDVLRESRVYVACETHDDLPYVLRYVGEDNLVIGSDYGHADTTAELEALRRFLAGSELDPRVIGKILDDNARALYGI
jgi:predicted TIM-barrel fold metal-dependent hydrolase